jgi:hypothetical protein
MNNYKDVYQNLMNIMNSIHDIQIKHTKTLLNPLTEDLIMQNHSMYGGNIINTNTLSSSNISTIGLSTNTIISKYPTGLIINNNYINNSGALLTVSGQFTSPYTDSYPSNNIFKINNDASVVVGAYERLITGSTLPALTVYGSIDIEDGSITAPNIISSITGDASRGITVYGTYAEKKVKLANPINSLAVTTGTISTLYSESCNISTYSTISGNIHSLYSSSCTINNLNITSGTIGNLYSNSSSIDKLTVTSGSISNLSANSSSIGNLFITNGTNGNIYNLSTTSSNLNTISGTINNLSINSSTMNSLSSINGTSNNIYSNSYSATNLNIINSTIGNLNTNSSSIGNLNTNSSTISNLNTNGLKLINLPSGNSNTIIGIDSQNNVKSQILSSGITNVINSTTYNNGYNAIKSGSQLTINTPNQSLNTDGSPLFNGLYINTKTVSTDYNVGSSYYQDESQNIQYFRMNNNITIIVPFNLYDPTFYMTRSYKSYVNYIEINNYVIWSCKLILSVGSPILPGYAIRFSQTNPGQNPNIPNPPSPPYPAPYFILPSIPVNVTYTTTSTTIPITQLINYIKYGSGGSSNITNTINLLGHSSNFLPYTSKPTGSYNYGTNRVTLNIDQTGISGSFNSDNLSLILYYGGGYFTS